MIYLVQNAPMQTTAAPVKVATGAAIKTLLQLELSTTVHGRIKEWGISLDGSAAATPGEVELIETDVAATVTAYAAADITKVDAKALAAGNPGTALISLGVAASGYTATAEGTITAIRNLDGTQLVAPTNQFIHQFPLGDEPEMQDGKFYRIRVTFPATVNAYCYIKFEI